MKILSSKCLTVSCVFLLSSLSCIILFYVFVAGMLFLLAYSAVMFLLGSYAAAAVFSVMQDSSLPALIASRVETQWLISSVQLSF